MGGYVNGSICSMCGGDAVATGDWRYGEKVETVECFNFDCGYVLTKENGNETGDYATQEQIQEGKAGCLVRIGRSDVLDAGARERPASQEPHAAPTIR